MNMNLSMKRVLSGLAAALVLVPAAIFWSQHAGDPGREHTSVVPENAAQQLKRGEYLAIAGNCMACHTVRGGEQFAGGRAIATPFGRFYSSNVTPDTETGIGSWTAGILARPPQREVERRQVPVSGVPVSELYKGDTGRF